MKNQNNNQRTNVCLLFLVLVFTLICFLPALNNGFTNWDDNVFIYENPLVLNLDRYNILTILGTTTHGTYVPLTLISFAIEHHFFGLNPFVYHLNNVLLHLLVTGLIFVFALQLGLKPLAGAFAALLFGIHPMHVESVAWITERKDVLYSFFYMLSLVTYGQYVKREQSIFYFCALLFAGLSILSKPMALSLPLILLLLDWFKGRRFDLKLYLEKIPFFIIIVLITRITFLAYKSSMLGVSAEGLLVWVYDFSFYITKFLFPLALNPYYRLPMPVTFFNPTYLLSCFVLMMSIITFFKFRTNRWVLFAFLFYFLSIFFLLRSNPSTTYVVTDRFMYLPSVGFCLLLGCIFCEALSRYKKQSWLISIGLVFIFVFCGVKTYAQTQIWKDSEALWNHVIKLDKDSAIAYGNRGIFYKRNGNIDSALLDLNKAIELNPEYVVAYINRSNLLTQLGRFDEAIDGYNNAEFYSGGEAGLYANRAICYAQKGDFDLAMEDYNRAIEMNPLMANAYYGRSRAYEAKGEYAKALEDALKAKELFYPGMDGYIRYLEEK